jgi:hypothetical protein
MDKDLMTWLSVLFHDYLHYKLVLVVHVVDIYVHEVKVLIVEQHFVVDHFVVSMLLLMNPFLNSAMLGLVE